MRSHTMSLFISAGPVSDTGPATRWVVKVRRLIILGEGCWAGVDWRGSERPPAQPALFRVIHGHPSRASNAHDHVDSSASRRSYAGRSPGRQGDGD